MCVCMYRYVSRPRLFRKKRLFSIARSNFSVDKSFKKDIPRDDLLKKKNTFEYIEINFL